MCRKCLPYLSIFQALIFLENNVKEFNLKKVKRLPVSGAFHSSLMKPAVEPFKRALNKSEIQDPVISVYSNVDGKKYNNAQHIRKQLPNQVFIIILLLITLLRSTL